MNMWIIRLTGKLRYIKNNSESVKGRNSPAFFLLEKAKNEQEVTGFRLFQEKGGDTGIQD